MADILLTFDYELFFGESGTPEKSIINPTNELIKIFENYNIKSTFFVDILYYYKILESKSIKLRDNAKIIEEQLLKLISNNHRLELHLHPHWVDAKYNGKYWIFTSYKNYKLHSFNEDEIFNFFRIGKQIIEDISKKENGSYKVKAFRAGGWCVQPFTKLLKAMSKNEIYIDSSVKPGFKTDGLFDFTESPDKEIYRFSDDVLIPSKNGLFIEIPVSVYPYTFFNKLENLLFKKLKKGLYLRFGDGKGMYYKFPKLKRPQNNKSKVYSLEPIKPNIIVNKIKNSQLSMINMVSHPKLLSNLSFNIFEQIQKLGCRFIGLDDAVEKIPRTTN